MTLWPRLPIRLLSLAGLLAASCAGAPPLTDIGDGWFIDQASPAHPAAHLYHEAGGKRVLVDRQIEAYRLYYSLCLVYQVARADGHTLVGVAGGGTPIAIVATDPVNPWRLDDDALRLFETPFDPAGRTLLKVTMMSISDICVPLQMQPRYAEGWAARARVVPGKFKIEESVLDVNGADSVGNSTLSDAAMNGRTATVDELLRAGADPNSANDSGVTVLMTGIAFQHPAVVRRLLAAGARVNAQDRRGVTALMCAAQYRSVQLAQLLLAAGADASIRDDTGQNAAGWVPENGGAELEGLREQLQQAATRRP